MIDEIQRLLAADLARGRRAGTHLHEATDRALALAAAGAPQLGAVALIADVLPELWLRGELGVDGLRSIVDSAAAVVEEPSDQFRLRLADRFYGGPGPAPPGSRARRRDGARPATRDLARAPGIALGARQRGACGVLRLLRQLSDQACAGARAGSAPGRRAGGWRAGLLLAAPVTRWGRPVGVIVTRPERGRRALRWPSCARSRPRSERCSSGARSSIGGPMPSAR